MESSSRLRNSVHPAIHLTVDIIIINVAKEEVWGTKLSYKEIFFNFLGFYVEKIRYPIKYLRLYKKIKSPSKMSRYAPECCSVLESTYVNQRHSQRDD